MYARVMGARKALPCLGRPARCPAPQPLARRKHGLGKIPTRLSFRPSSRSSSSSSSSSSSARAFYSTRSAAATIAVLACASLAGDRTVCERHKIVWVDACGKQVAVHDKGAGTTQENGGKPEVSTPSRYYPYVILGYGVAGQAALRALLERDPGAKVLIVDSRTEVNPVSGAREDGPSSVAQGNAGEGRAKGTHSETIAADANVEFATGVRATALDADLGKVTLVDLRLRHGTVDGGKIVREEVAFGRCLLALGSRSRPPPPGFVDPAAWEDVALLGSREGVDREGLRREIASGRAVTVVGSSWQALELACWLQEGRDFAEKGPGSGCRMVFPDYAPLDYMLPRYLSVALVRRLNKRGIKTVGHSSLRWIGRSSVLQPPAPEAVSPVLAPEVEARSPGVAATQSLPAPPAPPSSPPAKPSAADSDTRGESASPLRPSAAWTKRRRRLQVMTAHSFDHLDTALHSADRVVLAGVDVAPVGVTLDLQGEEAGGASLREGAVARRKRAGTLEVDARRGAVVVNAELSASARVWCAGDLACFPSAAHGGRRLVLRSADHAYHSGKLAGENMATAAAAATAAGVAGADGAEGMAGASHGARRYRHTPAFVGEAPLAGVRIATVGDCDAALPTHGFWWTNSATGLTRKTTVLGRHSTARPPEERQRASGVTLRSRKTVRKDFTPVFGTGVIFYTSGPEVRGAMLWGFPGEATAAAAMGHRGSSVKSVGVDQSPADEAAGISARALDLVRHVMERSANMEADLSDERVMQAWVQGLSDAAKAVAQETGLGHLQPMRRSVAGRVTSSTRRPPGTRDELMYQNTLKTSSAQRRLRAAYAARIRGVAPQAYPTYSSVAGDAEFDPEVLEFLGYGSGVFDEEEGDDSGADSP